MTILDLNAHRGVSATFAKTVGETDVYLFAGMTGDLAEYHTNEQVMSGTIFGGRIVHGALMVGFASTCGTRYWEAFGGVGNTVSAGYDDVRFIKPVLFGDTVNFEYVVSGVDLERLRVSASVLARNQHDEVVFSATHLTRVIDFAG